MTTTNTAAVETMRAAIGQLLNEFGERQWQSGRGVPHKSLEDAFDAIIERAALAAPAQPEPSPAQAVPAPGVEAVSEREFKQFLSDVLTAAGLVTHGKKCKDLGRRLGEMNMRLLTPPKTAAAPVQAGEYQPSSADMVMAALDTEEWGLERIQRCDYISDEGNRDGAWLVKRQKAPYCACYTDKPGAPYGPRSWSGPTALDALQKAADDLGIRLPQPAARVAAPSNGALATPSQPVAWQVNHIADHVADNWPMRKYDLAEIDQRLRGIPAAPQPAAQALDSVRVFWQQHTQADALSMTMAALHTDVELVIRAARGAAQAAPVDAAVKPAINAGTIGHVGSGRTTLTAALGKLIAAQKGNHD